MPSVSPPVPPVRYRCSACGNLTRFDVTMTRRTRSYHHYSLSGALSVEDPEVLSEIVEMVSCRWCGSGGAVQAIPPERPPERGAGPERPPERGAGPDDEAPAEGSGS